MTRNLAAWATAYIELNGLRALDEIEEKYLYNTNRTETEVRAIITALSVHGREGRLDRRDRIARGFATTLEFHPEVAGPIAKEFSAWKKWEYREKFADLLKKSHVNFERSEAQAIRNYLR